VSAAVAAGLTETRPEAPVTDSESGGQSVAELPDWSDPPTGQVPRVLLDDPDEDVAAYRSPEAQVRGPIWREHISDWDDEPDLAHLADEDSIISSGGGQLDDEDPFDFGFDFPLAPRQRQAAPEEEVPATGQMERVDAGTDAVPGHGAAAGVTGSGAPRPPVAAPAAGPVVAAPPVAAPPVAAPPVAAPPVAAPPGPAPPVPPPAVAGPVFPDDEDDDDGPDAAEQAWAVWTAPLSGSVAAVVRDAGDDGGAVADPTRPRRRAGLGSRLPALPGARSRGSGARHRKSRAAAPRAPLAADQPEAARAELVRSTRTRRVPSRAENAAPDLARREGRSGRRIGVATATGVGFAAIATGCFFAGSVATLVLAAVVVTMAAAELFAVLRRAGYKPATLVVLLAVPAAMVGGYLKGPSAVVLVTAATAVVTLVWYMLGLIREDPVANAGATLLGFAWVAVLGSFAGLILAPSMFRHGHGVALFLGAALAAASYDVGGLAIGSLLGRHKLAPRVSPNKTWEGLIGGMAVALVVSVAAIARIHPWDLRTALWLGVVVAVSAPLGDLCESMIKRALGVKDMGSLLPEHGGVLDRIDSLLFVFPAVYELVRILHIH
jgi:phosphatidate cytidylyltransferase